MLFKSVQRLARFSTKVPVPKPTESSLYEADVLSATPQQVLSRGVRIYRPAKTAMQSGTANTEEWKIDFDVQGRWENELMGWSSSADAVQALKIKFNSKEEAIKFAEKQGYNYFVQEPKETKFKVRTYSSNFKYNPKKLTWHHTK